MHYNEEEYLMLSGIQHFAFCRRQWALIHIEQQWADNYQTTSGELLHKRAHDGVSFEKRGSLLTARGLRISSSSLGFSGQCDIVEFHQGNEGEGIQIKGYNEFWNIIPVEYKRGTQKEGDEDEVQLCAQAICLEEMFLTHIDIGYLYYGENKRRVEVKLSSELRERVIMLCTEMHQYFDRGYTPNVKGGTKCKACSMKELCIPKMQKCEDVAQYIAKYIAEGSD